MGLVTVLYGLKSNGQLSSHPFQPSEIQSLDLPPCMVIKYILSTSHLFFQVLSLNMGFSA